MMAKTSSGPLAASPFMEHERKLSAANVGQLRRIRSYVLGSSHYATFDAPDFRNSLLMDFEILGAPQGLTDLRQRFYYDDIKLSGWKNGIEVRIEERQKEGQWPYGQVIKLASGISGHSLTLSRMEYPSRLKTAIPDIGTMDSAGKIFVKNAFNAKSLKGLHSRLLPLIEIVSQRWKTEYYPGGDPEARIEIALDVGRGRTFTGHIWDLFQLELEMKKGNPDVLEEEISILQEQFPFLTVEKRSKPSPGFSVLAAALENKALRRQAEALLGDGQFRLLSSPSP